MLCYHCERYSSTNIESCAMLYLWDIISNMEQSILNNSYSRIGIESDSSGIIQSNFDIMADSIDRSNYQSKSIWDKPNLPSSIATNNASRLHHYLSACTWNRVWKDFGAPLIKKNLFGPLYSPWKIINFDLLGGSNRWILTIYCSLIHPMRLMVESYARQLFFAVFL